MKIGIIPENLVERLALALGLVPVPGIEAWFSMVYSGPAWQPWPLAVMRLVSGPARIEPPASQAGDVAKHAAPPQVDHRASTPS